MPLLTAACLGTRQAHIRPPALPLTLTMAHEQEGFTL